MPRFLIEINHDDEHRACIMALRAIEKQGSHFMTKAEWGCKDGVHSGWVIIEVPTREDAAAMVPPEFRSQCRVVQLNTFSREEIQSLIAELENA